MPQPDAVTRMASSRLASASAATPSMLARARASASPSRPEVMGQRAATLLVPDQHDLDAMARQQVDGGLVDARRQHLLGAALQQRDAAAPLAGGRENAARRPAPAPAGVPAPAPASP